MRASATVASILARLRTMPASCISASFFASFQRAIFLGSKPSKAVRKAGRLRRIVIQEVPPGSRRARASRTSPGRHIRARPIPRRDRPRRADRSPGHGQRMRPSGLRTAATTRGGFSRSGIGGSPLSLGCRGPSWPGARRHSSNVQSEGSSGRRRRIDRLPDGLLQALVVGGDRLTASRPR